MANSYKFHNTIHDTYEVSCEMERKRVECAIMIKACLAYEVKEVNGNQALVKVVNKSTLNFEILLDNKAGTILGNATVEFKVRLNDKIKFN